MSIAEQQLEAQTYYPTDEHIIGLGVDIIETERIGRDIGENPLFAEEFCTPEEIAFCDEVSGEERRKRYAHRFSLKEAAIKALGGGGDSGIELELDWREIITNEDNVVLLGRAKRRADEQRITSLSFTFTEFKGLPIVVCIARGNQPLTSF